MHMTFMQARDSVQMCIETSKLRFARCTAVSVLPDNHCAASTYDTTVTFTMKKIPAGRALDTMDDDQLDILAGRLHDAIQEDCELDECDVKSFTGSDITVLSATEFNVKVKSEAVRLFFPWAVWAGACTLKQTNKQTKIMSLFVHVYSVVCIPHIAAFAAAA